MPIRCNVFLSHSSADKAAVEAIARKLREAGIEPFLDKWDLPAGQLWQKELDAALERCDAFLVFLGSRGLRGWQEEETLVALDRQTKRKSFPVIPVLLPGLLDPGSILSFLRQRTWVDFRTGLEDEEQLRRLVNGIRGEGPGSALEPSLPMTYRSMAPLPEAFVHRSEYDRVVEALCRSASETSSAVGITTGLRGAGGFGKTALAQAVCQDERVRQAYPDGILWTTMGENVDGNGRLVRIRDLIRWWTEEEPPAFETVAAAGACLRELFEGQRVLFVIDDVWSSADVEPLRGMKTGPALLVTTRESHTLPEDTRKIAVDAMAVQEAVRLLRSGLPEGESDTVLFQGLARRLGEWALLLKLVNRQLRELVEEDGFTTGEALQEVERALEREGLTAFDREDPESRHAAVGQTLAVSLRRLTDLELALYRQLAVFPEDVDIPLPVLERFWRTHHLETVKRCRKLNDLSLLLRFERREGTVRLHDVIRHYLIRQQGGELPNLHRRLLDVSRPEAGRWADLPKEETYLWKNLAWHLLEAGMRETLRGLLLDFPYLQAKLRAVDVNALLADYDPIAREDEEVRLVQGALRLSTHVLLKDPHQLAPHLLGRLLGSESPAIRRLLEQARSWRAPFWLRPRFPSFVAPGGVFLGALEGHTSDILAMAAVDGSRVVSASADQTLRVWDLETGQALRTIGAQIDIFRSVVAVVNGRRVVSTSSDNKLRVWDLETGRALEILEGHTDRVTAVTVLDGRRAVSASADKTLRVWDLETGQTLGILEGHTEAVARVAVVDGRRAVSASADKTLRVWDLDTGRTLRVLEGHTEGVHRVAVVDGRRAVSASGDKTLRVWDLATGRTLNVLEGHRYDIRALAVVDGRRAVSAGLGTLRVWDLKTGQSLRNLEGPSNLYSVVVVDGRRVVSAGVHALRVWDLETGEILEDLEGHTLNSVELSAPEVVVIGGRRAVSASGDHTLRVWNLEADQPLGTLEKHTSFVTALAVLDDRRAVSASDDTLWVWDLVTGKTLKTLKAPMTVNTLGVVDDRRAVFEGGVLDLDTGNRNAMRLGGNTVVLDGRRAVSATNDMLSSISTLRVWDLDTGLVLKTIETNAWWNFLQVAAVDDRRAVTTSSDWNTRVWDLETGEVLKAFYPHTPGVIAAVDGRRAISASGANARTLWVWDLETGETLQTLEGHTQRVDAVAVVNDRLAVSGSGGDKTLRVWDLETGECLTVLALDADPRALAVTPGGRTVVAGDFSGRVHFLDLVESERPGTGL